MASHEKHGRLKKFSLKLQQKRATGESISQSGNRPVVNLDKNREGEKREECAEEDAHYSFETNELRSSLPVVSPQEESKLFRIITEI